MYFLSLFARGWIIFWSSGGGVDGKTNNTSNRAQTQVSLNCYSRKSWAATVWLQVWRTEWRVWHRRRKLDPDERRLQQTGPGDERRSPTWRGGGEKSDRDGWRGRNRKNKTRKSRYLKTRGEKVNEGEANGQKWRPGFRRGHPGARAVIRNTGKGPVGQEQEGGAHLWTCQS